MSRRIWKYELRVDDGPQQIASHLGARAVWVEARNLDVLDVWVEVDPERPKDLLELVTVGTGHVHEQYGSKTMRYVGTTLAGPLVWHVYQLIDTYEAATTGGVPLDTVMDFVGSLTETEGYVPGEWDEYEALADAAGMEIG